MLKIYVLIVHISLIDLKTLKIRQFPPGWISSHNLKTTTWSKSLSGGFDR